MTRLGLLVLIALGLALGGAVTRAEAAIPANFAGVLADGTSLNSNIDFTTQVAAMKASGVGWIRIPVSWAEVEPQPGNYQFSKLDARIAAAASMGLEVMPIVIHAPYWAAEAPATVNARPQNPEQYGALMRVLAARYGSQGSFWSTAGPPYKPVRRWQVWNEPDMNYAWRTKSREKWQTSYVALLKAAKIGLRQGDPGAIVVLGGISNLSWKSLRLIYRGGGRPYFDVAALHPFSSRASGVIDRVKLFRREMRRWGDGLKPIILSEISWSSSNGRAVGLSTGRPFAWDTSEAGQARRLREVVRALAKNRQSLGIQSFAWATWLSPQPGSKYWFDYTGLNRLQQDRIIAKPALRAFRETITSLRKGNS